jgi:hypothetical protein
MGGSLTIVCRTASGQVHPLLRWTNPISGFVHHPLFLAKDEGYMQEYIDEPTPWHEDDSDFHQPILPSEYGIVFIDWQNNKIISANGYTSFGHNFTSEWEFPGSFLSQPEDKNKALYEQGKGKAVAEIWAPPGQEQQGFVTEGLSYEEFLQKLQKFMNEPGGARRSLCAVIFDMAPFEIINMMDDEKGLAKFKKLIEAEGVNVDEGWDNWIEERFGDY